ncbi:hypothetical protein HMPREF3039_02998 [Akkermansia sp. KLE1798]|nr:hypothetical protein HMPREF3039_02998 [Akkermansia sp. KLE1798]KZA04206.1 hypothetical protein HMPREF1326_02129 [Akkermansia sp. KLE1605]
MGLVHLSVVFRGLFSYPAGEDERHDVPVPCPCLCFCGEGCKMDRVINY